MSDFDTYSGTITASAQSVVADCQSNSGVYIWLQGTYAGAVVAFEGTADGGATWQAIGAYPVNAPGGTVQTLTPATNAFAHYYAMVGAAKQFRVRSTAFTSGSLGVNLCAVTDADPIQASAATNGAAAALTDAFVNPTEAHQAGDQFVFNGTTWDRERSNQIGAQLEATLSGKTASFNGAAQTNYNAAGAMIQLNVSVATGTTPTLVARVQYSIDGANYVDLDVTNAATASITTTGTYVIKVYPGIPTVAAGSCNSPLPRQWRLAYTIGGTTPSFTFATHVTYIN